MSPDSGLFYRLNVIPFQIPPLRERLEDVPSLVEHFNKRFSQKYGKREKQFSKSAVDALQSYTWLGNVRELRNTIERVIILSNGEKISADDLPKFNESDEPPASSFRFPSFKDATDAYQREFIIHKLREFDGNVTRAAESMGVDRTHLYRKMRDLKIEREK